MKKFFAYFFGFIICVIIYIFMALGLHQLTISNIERGGYTYIEYVHGTYKVYDNKTKVMYTFSSDASVFTPIYNADGTLMIYENN